MVSVTTGDYYFDKVIIKDNADSLLAGSCVYDSKSGDIILKLGNACKEQKEMKVDISRFRKFLRMLKKQN